LYAFLIASMRTTCPAHLTFPDVVKRTNYEVPNYAVFSSFLPPGLCIYIEK
jgi:hypothetical protein